MNKPLRQRVSKINLAHYIQYAVGWTMRVWREVDNTQPVYHEPGRTQIDEDIAVTISKFAQHNATPLELATGVLALPRVDCVEVLDFAGHGEKLVKPTFWAEPEPK